MNEFIVWNKKTGREVNVFVLNARGQILNPFDGNNEIDNTQICNYIGKKDINDKKIYADCSIVSFEWVDSEREIHYDLGYFRWNENYLSYFIWDGVQEWSIRDVLSLEVKSTVQQNPELLTH